MYAEPGRTSNVELSFRYRHFYIFVIYCHQQPVTAILGIVQSYYLRLLRDAPYVEALWKDPTLSV